jgi:pilus assembly protein Flp/PilA
MRAEGARIVAEVWAAARRLYASDCGATAVEYGLIVSFIAVALIIGAQMLGDSLNERFQFFADFFTP